MSTPPMYINREDMVSVTHATKHLSKLVNSVSEGRTFVVIRNNQPAAAMVDIDTMERLQRLEELEEDLRLLAIAWARTMTESGRRHDLDDVIEEFGIELDDED